MEWPPIHQTENTRRIEQTFPAGIGNKTISDTQIWIEKMVDARPFFHENYDGSAALDDAATALQGMRNQLEHALLAKKISMKTLRRIQKVCTNLERLEDTLTNFAAREQVERLHPSFLCPIGKEVMRDPVVAADGFTYERNSIEKHFKNFGQDPSGNFGSNLEHLIHRNQVFRYRDGMAQWAGVVGDSDDEDESNPIVEQDL